MEERGWREVKFKMLYCMALAGCGLWVVGVWIGSDLARKFGIILLGCAVGTIIAERIDR